MGGNVWFVMDGPEPTRGGPWREMSLEDCRRDFGLSPADYIGDRTPGSATKPTRTRGSGGRNTSWSKLMMLKPQQAAGGLASTGWASRPTKRNAA